MCSALIIDDSELALILKALSQESPSDLVQAYRKDAEIVDSALDPTFVLRKLTELPTDIKNIVTYWLQVGAIVGVECKGFLTPSGSVILDLGTYRGSKSIVDLKQVLAELEARELCYRRGRYVYLPGLFCYSDVAIILPEEAYMEKKIDELFIMGLDVPSVELKLRFGKVYMIDSYKSIQELYAEAAKDNIRYFFGEFITYIENLRHIPSIIPVVLDTPVDLVIITSRDVIAHKFVDIDKTLHRGLSSILKYVEYGFDKIVLVHLSRERADRITYRKTLMSLLNRRLLIYAGYVALYGYEIDHVLVFKVPMYNKAMEYFRHTNVGIRRMLRQHLARMR